MEMFKYLLEKIIVPSKLEEFKPLFGDLVRKYKEIVASLVSKEVMLYDINNSLDLKKLTVPILQNRFYSGEDLSELFIDNDKYYSLLNSGIKLKDFEIWAIAKRKVGYKFSNDPSLNNSDISLIKLNMLIQSALAFTVTQESHACPICRTTYPIYTGLPRNDRKALIDKFSKHLICNTCGDTDAILGNERLTPPPSLGIEPVYDSVFEELEIFLGKSTNHYGIEDILI